MLKLQIFSTEAPTWASAAPPATHPWSSSVSAQICAMAVSRSGGSAAPSVGVSAGPAGPAAGSVDVSGGPAGSVVACGAGNGSGVAVPGETGATRSSGTATTGRAVTLVLGTSGVGSAPQPATARVQSRASAVHRREAEQGRPAAAAGHAGRSTVSSIEGLPGVPTADACVPAVAAPMGPVSRGAGAAAIVLWADFRR